LSCFGDNSKVRDGTGEKAAYLIQICLSQICKRVLLIDINHKLHLKRFLNVSIVTTVFVLMILPMSPLRISNAASQITVPTDFPTIQSEIVITKYPDEVDVDVWMSISTPPLDFQAIGNPIVKSAIEAMKRRNEKTTV
jgi:hypothetical protein